MSHLQTLRELFRELLGWKDSDLDGIDFLMSSFTATFFPGSVERPWACLIGPASTGKSEMLKIVEEYCQTVKRDKITANAFASAYRDEKNPDDVSLVHLLSYAYNQNGKSKGNKVLVIPDMTTVLSTDPQRAREFLSDLRAAFDGTYNVQAGNIGEIKSGFLGFGVILACTPIMDDYQKSDQTMGQRLLTLRLTCGNDTMAGAIGEAGNANRFDRIKKAALKKKIAEVAALTITEARVRIANGANTAAMTPEQSKKLETLAAMCVRMRTIPTSMKSLSAKAEGPGRVVQQLRAWGDARAVLEARTEWNDRDLELCARIVHDTVPPDLVRMLEVLWQGSKEAAKKPVKSSLIARRAHNSIESTNRQLMQWSLINLVVTEADQCYRLRQDVIDAIEYTDFMKGVKYE